MLLVKFLLFRGFCQLRRLFFFPVIQQGHNLFFHFGGSDLLAKILFQFRSRNNHASIEYILIPLLMRCLKVTDELAASGTTRGLELECKRYALRPIRFSWPEVLVSLLGVVFLAALLFLDQTRIGEIILWRV